MGVLRGRRSTLGPRAPLNRTSAALWGVRRSGGLTRHGGGTSYWRGVNVDHRQKGHSIPPPKALYRYISLLGGVDSTGRITLRTAAAKSGAASASASAMPTPYRNLTAAPSRNGQLLAEERRRVQAGELLAAGEPLRRMVRVRRVVDHEHQRGGVDVVVAAGEAHPLVALAAHVVAGTGALGGDEAAAGERARPAPEQAAVAGVLTALRGRRADRDVRARDVAQLGRRRSASRPRPRAGARSARGAR